MAQVVSCQVDTAAKWAQSATVTLEICGGKIGNGTGLSTRASVFPTQNYSTNFPNSCSNLSQKMYIRRNRQGL
jgi:hypothetical protein